MEIYYEQGSSKEGLINKIKIFHANFNNNGGYLEFHYLHVGKFTLDDPVVLDGYVCAVIFYAMQYADVIKVHGPLSQDFIKNIRLFCEAWACWLPNIYACVQIEAAKILPNKPINLFNRLFKGDEKKSLSAFSGGVDASFTLLRHAKQDGLLSINERYNLQDVVMVHGFDVEYENQADFDLLFQKAQTIFNHLHIECHTVKTNIKTQISQNWEHSHASQLSSVLHQFGANYRYGVIGSTWPYTNMMNAWGSHPATDYLLSGSDFRIIHDGAGFTRSQKIANMATHDFIINNLKVCWEGRKQDQNCGFCEKCIRTKLHFLANGLKIPISFNEGLCVEDITNLKIKHLARFKDYKAILQLATNKGKSNDILFCELEKILKKHAGNFGDY